MDAVRLALNTRDSNEPSTGCVLKRLQICLYINNFIIEENHLLQTKEQVPRIPVHILILLSID